MPAWFTLKAVLSPLLLCQNFLLQSITLLTKCCCRDGGGVMETTKSIFSITRNKEEK